MGTRVWSKGLDLRSNAKRFVGSNPTSSKVSYSVRALSVWRNWIARQTSNLKVAGSNPVMDKVSH